jgi:acyl dehydratase
VPLNPALVGRTYPPVRYEVCREKLREFATAVGEHDPLYHDEAAARAAGFADLPAVPTFPVVLSYQVGQRVYADPELGLDYARVLHGEQEFTYQRPVLAGDRLVATGQIARITSRARHEQMTVATRIETDGGELVCVASSTIVVRAEPAAPEQAVPAAEGVGTPVPGAGGTA